MNAGELKKVVHQFDKGLVYNITLIFFLLGVGSLILFFQLFNEKILGVISLGVVFIFLGLTEVSTLRKGMRNRHTLKEYEQKWLLVRWNKENLVKKIGLLVPDDPDTSRYALNLVEREGVGPYSPGVLFSVIHSAKMHELERSLTLGMIDLLGSNHLVRTVGGYTWSEKCREKFLELNPVWHEFDPNDCRTYSYGAFHQGNMD